MLELEAGEPQPPAGLGIRDQVALGTLTATYLPELVDQVLAATVGRNSAVGCCQPE
jgi:hypothetical protein